MKLSEALTLIQKLYGWDLSPNQQKVFVDLMRTTHNPQQIIDNWAIYHHDNPNKSPLHFKVWFIDNINLEETEKQTQYHAMNWEKSLRTPLNAQHQCVHKPA